MSRRLLAAACVCLLAVSAGCTGLFGGGVSDADLDQDPYEPYDWNTSQNVTVTIYGNHYQIVYNLSNRSKLWLWNSGLETDSPLNVWSVRYRYPNGTVLNGSEIEVYTEGSSRVIEPPQPNGQIAYSAQSGIKTFGMPGFMPGSYEVILPPDRRASSFIFGNIEPGGYETRVDDQNRLHIVWEEANNGVFVRYYLTRDLLLFRGLVALLALAGLVGVAYFVREIRRLEDEREELGLNVDTDDDLGDGPPPGLR